MGGGVAVCGTPTYVLPLKGGGINGKEYDKLRDILQEMKSLVVAYSGGVDSAFLAWTARQVLGDRSLAVIGNSPSLARYELDTALRNAARMDFSVQVLKTYEADNPDYLRNADNRCFFCKTELFNKLLEFGKSKGFSWVACGDNRDDLLDDRPGMKAASDLGVRAPLREAGLGKEALRALSRESHLPTWDKPATACLASRIPHGTLITVQRLGRVERAEEVLRSHGFRQIRVRDRGSKAFIQVGPEEVSRLQESSRRAKISSDVKSLGFSEVEIDPLGYGHG